MFRKSLHGRAALPGSGQVAGGGLGDVLLQLLVVPGPAKLFGLMGREEDYILPWEAVTQMGSDIILIDGKADIRRGRRDRGNQ